MHQISELDDATFQERKGNFTHELQILIFLASWDKPSHSILSKLYSTIPMFHQVTPLNLYSQKCPSAFRHFEVEYTPTLLITRGFNKSLKRIQIDDSFEAASVLEQLSDVINDQRTSWIKKEGVWFEQVTKALKTPVVVLKGHQSELSELEKCLKDSQVTFNTHTVDKDETQPSWLGKLSNQPQVLLPFLFVNGKFLGNAQDCHQKIGDHSLLQEIPIHRRRNEPEQRFKDLIYRHPSIVLVQGFPFQDKETLDFITKVQAEYEKNPTLYNLSTDKHLLNFVGSSLKIQLPSFYHHGKLVTIDQ